MIRFPIDCPNDCPHHKQWDLSVDDYTHYCDLLKVQMDEFDYGFAPFLVCPKEEESE